MSQTFGHFLIAHEGIKKVLPEIAVAYPGHISFGCQGPDMFYTLQAGIGGYSDIADIIHSCNTLPFFASLLEGVKQFTPESREHQAARAYAYGFYSHVIADCIYHPYVNRLANNNWVHGGVTKDGRSNHKAIETYIDDCLLSLNVVSKDDFLPNLFCPDPDNPLKVDPAVASIQYASFHRAYKYDIDVPALVDRDSLEEMDHTLHRAYRAYLSYNYLARVLVDEGININAILSQRGSAGRIAQQGQWSQQENGAMNIYKLPWSNAPGNEILNYSGEELFMMAVAATAEVVRIGENFLESGQTDALEYLMNQQVPFLTEDYNLDTGLPSRYNQDQQNCDTDPTIRFAFMVPKLKSNYCRFET